MTMLQHGMVGSAGGYQIDNSLRFRASASAYLSRTFGAPTTQNTFTLSTWVKRGALGSHQPLFSVEAATDSAFSLGNITADRLELQLNDVQVSLPASILLRDTSAHYHLVYSQNGTAVKLYLNGAEVISTTGTNTQFNVSGNVHKIGARRTSYLDGLATEIRFIDGQALDPSYFGELNTDGVWVPKAYTGTYGNNGFYLPFDDATSLTTLGYDRSGNGNNWTCNNISLTSGVTYDHMVDTPTNNYVVLNAISTGRTLSSANLDYAGAASGIVKGTIGVSSGKWYWECHAATGSPSPSAFGLCAIDLAPTTSYVGATSNSWCYAGSAIKYNNGSGVAYGATYATGDVIGIAFDADFGSLEFFKNGVSQGVAYTGITGSTYTAAAGNNTVNDAGKLNFGQRPFAYTPPTGFKALCASNGAAVAITNPQEHHNVYTVTKSGNTNFTLDWDASVYDTYFEIKRRDASGDWYNVDGLRGYDKILKSNSTAAETTDANVIGVSGTTITLKSTLADGTYVISAWKAGLTASRQTNTDGTITSTVSRNVTSGFAIVLYSGTAANATVGHGLGKVAAEMVVKNRGASATSWAIYHIDLGATKWIPFDTNAALTASTVWNNTSPTSSVFSIGTASNTGTASTFVAYVHAAIPGYSAFGAYSGNGSADGPNPYLGFKARWFRAKLYDQAGGNWVVLDTARDPYNPAGKGVYANVTNAEATTLYTDIDAGSVKLRHDSTNMNTSGYNYLYSAYASSPFGGENVAPATAR
jgi:hypothetical protein